MSESEPKPSGPGPTAGFIFFESQRKRTKRNSVTCGGHFCCGRSVLWRPPIEKYRLSSPWVPLAKRGDGVSGLPGFFLQAVSAGKPFRKLVSVKKHPPCAAAGVKSISGGISEECLRRSRVLRARRKLTEWRGPGGQGAGARFSADSFVAQQKSQAAAGAATPDVVIFVWLF